MQVEVEQSELFYGLCSDGSGALLEMINDCIKILNDGEYEVTLTRFKRGAIQRADIIITKG